MLLTNDGDLANRIAHPSHGIEKEYLVEVTGGAVSAGSIRALREGVLLDDGMTAPAKVSATRARRAANHDPRGPQPADTPDVRGGRAPGDPSGAHPDRTDSAIGRCNRARWRELTIDEWRALTEAVAERSGQPPDATDTIDGHD